MNCLFYAGKFSQKGSQVLSICGLTIRAVAAVSSGALYSKEEDEATNEVEWDRGRTGCPVPLRK